MGLAALLEGPGVEVPDVLPSSWPSPRVLSLRLRGRALSPEAWGESARGLGVEDREEEEIMIEYTEAVTGEVVVRMGIRQGTWIVNWQSSDYGVPVFITRRLRDAGQGASCMRKRLEVGAVIVVGGGWSMGLKRLRWPRYVVHRQAMSLQMWGTENTQIPTLLIYAYRKAIFLFILIPLTYMSSKI
ncbi:hypothetical protein M7I_2252 [Glarea lozoyensis 74030]|uniref:Uncharacterized protein n=1 Tax=Glarea lozoyensis (strain ATCC 74030 / MF5533) TaxID=1104152 RepID=H0EI99_GLAL7|nr:hypothetical protein M7I_2252 [Glarea lozoyensis 74030]